MTRLFLARFKLGMFDPPERVKYAQMPFSVNEAPAHEQLAREMAQASMVLLKNTGVLPLAANTKTIAVIGPNADEVMTLVGNYNGTPSKPVTLVQGIRNAVPAAKVLYARGVDLVEGRQDPRAVPPIPSQFLRPAAGSTEQGLKGEYFKGKELQGQPVVTRIDRAVNFRWDRLNPTTELVLQGQMTREQALGNDEFSVRWTGQIVAPVTGKYEVTVTGDDGFRLDVAGARVLDEWTPTPRARARTAMLDFEAGQAYDVKLEYFENIRDAEVRLNWRQPGAKDPYEEALEAARAADVVIFAGGLNGEVEGEEMPVIYPGFAGGDRTEIALPKTQQKLLEDLHTTGKPVVLVLMTGSALAVEWAKANLPAVLVAWYPGQQGGNAHRRRAVRQGQPVRPPAGHVLQVGRRPAAVRRLFDEEPDLQVLHRRAALRVRPRPVVYTVRLHGDADRAGGRRGGRRLRRVVRRAEHRHAGRARGAAALRARPRRRAADAAARAARLHAHPSGAGRPAARILPRHQAGPGVLRRSGEALRRPRRASTRWRPAARAPTCPSPPASACPELPSSSRSYSMVCSSIKTVQDLPTCHD